MQLPTCLIFLQTLGKNGWKIFIYFFFFFRNLNGESSVVLMMESNKNSFRGQIPPVQATLSDSFQRKSEPISASSPQKPAVISLGRARWVGALELAQEMGLLSWRSGGKIPSLQARNTCFSEVLCNSDRVSLFFFFFFFGRWRRGRPRRIGNEPDFSHRCRFKL